MVRKDPLYFFTSWFASYWSALLPPHYLHYIHHCHPSLYIHPFVGRGTDTSVIQDFVFNLGHPSSKAITKNAKMATICKVTRSQIPPTFTTVADCFNYAFANAELRGK